MPLELLEYKVFRETFLVPSPIPRPTEIDSDTVPAGQVWRCEQLAVGLFVPNSIVTYPPGGELQPLVLVYDAAGSGPTSLPCELTALSPIALPSIIPADNYQLWADVDDDSGIVLNPGQQLAVLFQSALATCVCAVRAQFAVYQGTAGTPQPAAGLGPAPSISPSL